MNLPTIPSPPLVPFVPNLPQAAFLAFHNARHMVTVWRWHFGKTQLRATNEANRAATIWSDDLDELIGAGLMVKSHGESVELTLAGRLYLDAQAILKEVRT